MNKKKKCSVDEELMMCAAYRYAIGRHTYINTLANYIASEYYNRLSDERLSFTSRDIIETINNCLLYGPVEIRYDGTVNYAERDALDDLLTWMSTNVTSKDDLDGIEKLEVYKKSYKTEDPKLFRVYKVEPKIEHYRSQSDINDLICWYTLAQVFDKTKYKTLKLKNGEEVLAVQSWHKKVVECDDGYYREASWQWEKCWKPVNRIVEGKDNYFIPNENVESIL